MMHSSPNDLRLASKQYHAHESAIIDEGAIIGKNVSIWHFSHLMPGCEIGEDCNLGQNVFVAGGVRLGRNVKVQNNVSIYSGVHCEDDVFLGPSMVFTNVFNPRSAINRKNEYRQTLIKRGASIGANATVICGVTVGEYALVGAGSVVTRDVRPYALVMGNPARQTAWVSEYGHKLSFGVDKMAICPESSQVYQLMSANRIKKII